MDENIMKILNPIQKKKAKEQQEVKDD